MERESSVHVYKSIFYPDANESNSDSLFYFFRFILIVPAICSELDFSGGSFPSGFTTKFYAFSFSPVPSKFLTHSTPVQSRCANSKITLYKFLTPFIILV